jgi:hypothetical protein
VDGGGIQKYLSRPAPDDDDAIDLGLEFLDVGAELLGEVALALAGLGVGAVEALDVVPIEDGGHGLDGFEKGLDAGEVVAVEHGGVAGGLVHVFRENVPSGEDDVVEVSQGDEFSDQRRAILVRLPRRMVPICVTEPMGLASPLRTASTPAIRVVATAPMPTVITPSLPLAGWIADVFVPAIFWLTAIRGGENVANAKQSVSRVRRKCRCCA